MNITSDNSGNFYDDSIVIDGCSCFNLQEELWRYQKGRVTAVVVPVYPLYANTSDIINEMIKWYDLLDQNTQYMGIYTADDVLKAKSSNKLGIILSLMDPNDIQANLSILKAYYRLGIRRIQFFQNRQNSIGSSYMEEHDNGLSTYGKKIVRMMNELGIMIDLSHAGYRTSLDIIEESSKPVVFSHSNARSIYNVPRNIADEQAIAVAEKGGLIGTTAFPAFLSQSNYPDIELLLNHIDYLVNLVGIDHVAWGIEYYWMQEKLTDIATAMSGYQQRIEIGLTDSAIQPPPYHYPPEIQLPEFYPNAAEILVKHGYSQVDVKKLLGENYLRVFRSVWK